MSSADMLVPTYLILLAEDIGFEPMSQLSPTTD